MINIGSIDGLQVPLLETYAYSHEQGRRAPPDARPRARARRREHITVNADRRRPVREQDDGGRRSSSFRDAIEATCPLGRIGAPEDMAGVAIYLASRAGAYVTGAVIPVDGRDVDYGSSRKEHPLERGDVPRRRAPPGSQPFR